MTVEMYALPPGPVFGFVYSQDRDAAAAGCALVDGERTNTISAPRATEAGQRPCEYGEMTF